MQAVVCGSCILILCERMTPAVTPGMPIWSHQIHVREIDKLKVNSVLLRLRLPLLELAELDPM